MDDALHDPLAWVAARAKADPVRQRVLEGLARRAAAQSGALRERLVARLLQHAEVTDAAPVAVLPARAPSPLGLLVAQLQSAGPELRHVQAHEGTWRRLRLTQRLAEVSAPVPEHLGPLNSQVLVARTLQELKSLSPGYLQRLLTLLDALAALAPLQAIESTAADKPARKATRSTSNKTATPRRR
ncbi:MAG: DUF2894 domain-containing protein [Burkholderiales bacterium]|nr:MAG: DUF2894 domain-containing protein [Burkholderiales bacterium]